MHALGLRLDAALNRHPYTDCSARGGPSACAGLSVYAGPSGRTRKERVLVFRAEPEPKEVEMLRVVNVGEDPELRGAALAGTLDELDEGELIDVPFANHDPLAQQLVVMSPHAARGRELSERAKLVDSLSAVDALRRLERFEQWSSPDEIEEALLVVSIPRTAFELSRRRIVSDGARFGLAMSDGLALQAVRFGWAPSAQELVASLGRRFEEILSSASAQGLRAAQGQANQEALARLSHIHGTSTLPGLSCTMQVSG